MARLFIIKHAQPQIRPDIPSARWTLSAEGRERCGWLADRLTDAQIARLYCSVEPKAVETGALTAAALGLALRPRQGLQENDRTGLGFIAIDELRGLIGRFFDEPDQRVMGLESAAACLSRFETAVAAALAEASFSENVAIIAHGAVMTLLVARHNDVSPVEFWARLGSPCVVELDAQSLRLTRAPRAPR